MLVKKVNDELDETEVQIEIPHSDTLAAVDAKSITCHVCQKDKALAETHWDPK